MSDCAEFPLNRLGITMIRTATTMSAIALNRFGLPEDLKGLKLRLPQSEADQRDVRLRRISAKQTRHHDDKNCDYNERNRAEQIWSARGRLMI
jgi:hypothetical protein